VNKQISQIGVASLVLLAALIVGTTYWQTWANAGLANRQDNEIRLVAQFSNKRGKIYGLRRQDAAGHQRQEEDRGPDALLPSLPSGPLFADVVGYSTQSRNRTGLEQSYNDYLTGSNANLDTGVPFCARQAARGDGDRERPRPHDPGRPCRRSAKAPAGEVRRDRGARALDGSRARMVTQSDYNPNLIERHFAQATRRGLERHDRAALPCRSFRPSACTAGRIVRTRSFPVTVARAACRAQNGTRYRGSRSSR